MNTEVFLHNNHKIIFADYAKLESSRMIDLVNELFQQVESSNGKVKILSNYGDTSISVKFIDVSTEWAKKCKPKIDRYAVYGLNTPKRIMLNSFNSVTNLGIKAFDSREEALKYLTE